MYEKCLVHLQQKNTAFFLVFLTLEMQLFAHRSLVENAVLVHQIAVYESVGYRGRDCEALVRRPPAFRVLILVANGFAVVYVNQH